MNKESVMALSIPIIFAIGIIAFFALLPAESITLSNFIAYVASLSTAIMVLVYLSTTSRQLNAMYNQLREMQFSRNLQTQPLPFLTTLKAKIERPHLWVDPKDRFLKPAIACRIILEGKIENLGNGPAVAIDFIPRILCAEYDKQFSDSELPCVLYQKKPKEIKTIETTVQRVACLSLKEGDSKDVKWMFADSDNMLLNSIVTPKPTSEFLETTVLYKNVLGASFRAEFVYGIDYSDKSIDKMKSCAKVIETVRIDFGTDLVKYENLASKKEYEEMKKISEKISKGIEENFKFEDVPLELNLISGVFSVSPITEEEYRKEISKLEQRKAKELPSKTNETKSPTKIN